MTSASETLATVTPIALTRLRIWAIAGHLNAFAWGRQFNPRVLNHRDINATLNSKASRSSRGRRVQEAHGSADRADGHGRGISLQTRRALTLPVSGGASIAIMGKRSGNPQTCEGISKRLEYSRESSLSASGASMNASRAASNVSLRPTR